MTERTPLSIAEIRRQYPEPISDREFPKPQGTYCVGMAVMLAHGAWENDSDSFPGEGDLAEVLCALNPALEGPRPGATEEDVLEEIEQSLAYAFAEQITSANDAGDVDEAWEIAGRALDYPTSTP